MTKIIIELADATAKEADAVLSERISRAPDDNAVLALAAAAGADLVISGDADLPAVARYGDMAS